MSVPSRRAPSYRSRGDVMFEMEAALPPVASVRLAADTHDPRTFSTPLRGGRVRLPGGSGAHVIGSTSTKRSLVVAASERAVTRSEVSVRPLTSSFELGGGRATASRLAAGGLSTSNATSPDNPLATSYYHTADRPAAGRRR